MKKIALFFSICLSIGSLSASTLNVVYKQSESCKAFVRIIDVTQDYTSYMAQFYTSSSEWAGINPLFSSKYHYYKMILENASEDQLVVYHAKDGIKNSIGSFKKLIDARRFQFFLGSLGASATCAFSLIGLVAGGAELKNRHLSSNQMIAMGAFAAGIVASAFCLDLLARMRSQLEKLDGKVCDSMKVERALQVKENAFQESQSQTGLIYAGQKTEGLNNSVNVYKNAEGSIIIVSDHTLQNVEIEIQQINKAYCELIIRECNELS